MGKKIIAGPWNGEMGWLLMRWQGIFRKLSDKGFEIVMCGNPDHKVLYEDYIEEYVDVDPIYGETDGWRVNGDVPKLSKEILDQYPNHKYMSPETCMRIGIDPLGDGQRFIKYGTTWTNNKEYILIHPRCTNKGESNIRNWSINNWVNLINKLNTNKIFDIYTIGSQDDAYNLSNHCGSYIGIDMKLLMDIISSASLVVGPSSGPMHLASLCGTPHLVWTDDKFWGSCNGTNRDRYERNWNPLGAKAIVLDEDNWQPSVNKVEQSIKRFFNDTIKNN